MILKMMSFTVILRRILKGGENMNFQCRKCNSKKYFLDRVGVHVGLYCADCGTWQKWLNKQEYRLFKRFQEANQL